MSMSVDQHRYHRKRRIVKEKSLSDFFAMNRVCPFCGKSTLTLFKEKDPFNNFFYCKGKAVITIPSKKKIFMCYGCLKKLEWKVYRNQYEKLYGKKIGFRTLYNREKSLSYFYVDDWFFNYFIYKIIEKEQKRSK